MNYINLLKEVLYSTKKKEAKPAPVLLFGKEGYSFNGQWFGSDEIAAKEARDQYYQKLK